MWYSFIGNEIYLQVESRFRETFWMSTLWPNFYLQKFVCTSYSHTHQAKPRVWHLWENIHERFIPHSTPESCSSRFQCVVFRCQWIRVNRRMNLFMIVWTNFEIKIHYTFCFRSPSMSPPSSSTTSEVNSEGSSVLGQPASNRTEVL